MILLALLVVAVVVGPSAVDAQRRIGDEFRVNTYTTGMQLAPSVAMDDAGNFVVVWVSDTQDGNVSGVFGQRFANGGAPWSGEFQVNTYTTNHQYSPSVVMDAAGNFVVVWRSLGQDGSFAGVFGQRFDSDSAEGPEFRVNTYTTGNQVGPSVAMDASGNFVVVWHGVGSGGDGFDIFRRRYKSNGNPVIEVDVFPINTYTTGSQQTPSVARDPDGNFVVVWESYEQDGSMSGVFGQRFNSDNLSEGPEFRVNTYTTGQQRGRSVAMDASGNFVVVWFGAGSGGSGYDVFRRRYKSNGNPVIGEVDAFPINTYTTGLQLGPSVARDDAGNFVVVWRGGGNQDGSGYGIFGQRFTGNGARLGGEFRVNTYTTGNQGAPSVAMDRGGNFVVVWEGRGQGDSYGVFGQLFRFGEIDFFIGYAEEGVEADPSPRPVPTSGERR